MGVGGEKAKKKKFMQGRVSAKNIVQISEGKKFLQSELQCRAYKLYPSEWQLGSHFILQF